MKYPVYVLQVTDSDGPWAPEVYKHCKDAIIRCMDILFEWFPSGWNTDTAKVAQKTLETNFKYIFFTETQTVKFRIYPCSIF